MNDMQPHWHRGREVYWRTTAPTWRESLLRIRYSHDGIYLDAPDGFKPFIWKDKFGFWFIGIRRVE